MHVRSEVRLTSTGALVVWGEREFIRTSAEVGFEMEAVVSPPPPQPITSYRVPEARINTGMNTGFPSSGGERSLRMPFERSTEPMISPVAAAEALAMATQSVTELYGVGTIKSREEIFAEAMKRREVWKYAATAPNPLIAGVMTKNLPARSQA